MPKKSPGSFELGTTVRNARTEQGWTQTQLANMAGISRPSVARVEAGHIVSTETLAKIAEALGLRLELSGRGRD